MLTPHQQRHGLQLQTGSIPDAPMPIVPPRGAGRALIEQFPGYLILPVGFRSIPLANPAITAGHSAWFGLAKWRVPEDTGQQAQLSGYRIEMGAMNPTPAVEAAGGQYVTLANMAAWGHVSGTGAALVIGLNLPCREGAWSSGPANIPYVEGPTVQRRWKRSPANWIVLHFPPGKHDDSPSPMLYRNSQSTPLVINLTQGNTLDVALVVNRAQIHGVTKTDGIVGKVHGELLLSSTLTAGEF